MEVTINQVNNILKTLPISLYVGRKIDVSLSEEADTSYYRPMEDDITIAYNNIAGVMDRLQDLKDSESVIRGLLFHECSHSMLTKKDLYGKEKGIKADAINIFEDERIETVLKDYFRAVDFKRNIILINNWHGEEATDPIGDFYNTVRFRHGKEKFLVRVSQMITRYYDIKQNIDSYYWNQNAEVNQYREDIIILFLDIVKEWYEENDKDKLTSIDPNYDDSSEAQQRATAQEALEGDHPEEMLAKVVLTSAIDIPEDAKPIDIDLSEEELDTLLEEAEKNQNMCDKTEKPQELLDSILNKFVDYDLVKSISGIFENFLSREKNNSSAMNRYSGQFNPRLVGREDWRCWTYKSNNGPIKGYDKLHLNLFIDTSGSYKNNEDKTNTLLKALDMLEDKYPFFSFDLVTMQCGEQKHNKKQRYIEAYGGNRLDEEIFEIYNSLQDHQSFNYNLILFDGNAFTDCWGSKIEYEKNFGAFNNNKCSIISDDDNEGPINKYAPLAHSIIVKRGRGQHKSYAELLTDNVLTCLTRALL